MDSTVSPDRTTYFSAVRHPWPILVLLVPLVAGYELVVSQMAGPSGESLRAGVDLWLRKWMAESTTLPPALLPAGAIGLLALWAMWRWFERPERLFTTLFGMALEGVVFGIGLYALCLNGPAIWAKAGLPTLALTGPQARAVSFVGVGFYEELLFRLIGFLLLARLLNTVLIPMILAMPLALAASAGAFAIAHHWVEGGPFSAATFMSLTLAGLYLGLLVWWRGLGVAVVAHIVYDLVVGLAN